ncbi:MULTISPECIES: succinate dehydrogenase assembly factor 4 [Azospirillaceae]|jgi:hypothetical protein|uniref:DUF1674 domain-containing protein n=1 Tax=Azospirillaceae TaxID=2829815 RepID=UPI000B69C783|nr:MULTISPECIES: succinate dehydrogenase assembly factor 4 [Azospirillaceae]MDG5494905.1 DUF1674 domain-containing protein [Niveispirillum sp. BGYR6]SNS25378.1 Protein of unknown function [Azospirillum sp. RU38E]SNS43847.1 Protein of unknown function [Azospirillum sp. RU37A]
MTEKNQEKTTGAATPTAENTPPPARPAAIQQPPGEIGGREGPEPTRYGDWEVNGRCSDF